MSHRSNKEPLDRFRICIECGHSNHKSRVRCHHCDAKMGFLEVFKEIDPFIRDYIIDVLKPAIEQLEKLVNAGRYQIEFIPLQKDTKLALKPVIEHLQGVVDSLTPIPKFPREGER